MELGIIRIIGIVVFLYLVWKNLKDDYQQEKLIAYGWLMVLVFNVAGRVIYGIENWGIWNENPMDWLSFWTRPGFDFIGGYLAIILASWWACRVNGWKIWPFLEDNIGNLLLLLMFFLGDDFLRSRFDMGSGLILLSCAIAYLLGTSVKGKYRSFMWYKSGKKGFVFWAVNTILFVCLAVISTWLSLGWSLVINWTMSLLSLVGLFMLGEIIPGLDINWRKK